MSGMFDWHVTGILSRTWRELIAPNPDRFAELFVGPGGQQSIPREVMLGWHAQLTKGSTPPERAAHVRFRTAYAPAESPIPQVTIAMLDEPEDVQPLGYEGPPTSDGQRQFTMVLREEVSVDIWAPHPDITRALHLVTRGILMAHVDDFVRLGYIGLTYQGGADLMPEDELMPGAAYHPEVFRRSQRWSCISQPVWKAGAISRGQPHVYAADVTVHDIDGGVSPDWTATESNLPEQTQPHEVALLGPNGAYIINGTGAYLRGAS